MGSVRWGARADLALSPRASPSAPSLPPSGGAPSFSGSGTGRKVVRLPRSPYVVVGGGKCLVNSAGSCGDRASGMEMERAMQGFFSGAYRGFGRRRERGPGGADRLRA